MMTLINSVLLLCLKMKREKGQGEEKGRGDKVAWVTHRVVQIDGGNGLHGGCVFIATLSLVER